MAVNTLKEFSMQWVLGGLLLTCMLAFSISFMFTNNPIGFGEDGVEDKFTNARDGQTTLLDSSQVDADDLLNITANTNPEASDLGSRDSVATSYSATGSAKSYWNAGKMMMAWVFSGAIGKMLIGVISGLIGLMSYFFITKHIRTGD